MQKPRNVVTLMVIFRVKGQGEIHPIVFSILYLLILSKDSFNKTCQRFISSTSLSVVWLALYYRVPFHKSLRSLEFEKNVP